MTTPQITQPSTSPPPMVDVHFEELPGAWFISHRPSGPAGSATLRLDTVTVVTDVAQPHIALAAVVEADETGSAPAGEVELVELLFGQQVGELLRRPEGGRVPYVPPLLGAAGIARSALIRLVALAGNPDGVAPIALCEIARYESMVAGSSRALGALLDATATATQAASFLRLLPAPDELGVDHAQTRALTTLVNEVFDMTRGQEDLGPIGRALVDTNITTRDLDIGALEEELRTLGGLQKQMLRREISIASGVRSAPGQVAIPRRDEEAGPPADVRVPGLRVRTTRAPNFKRLALLYVTLEAPFVPILDLWISVVASDGSCTFQRRAARSSWERGTEGESSAWHGEVLLPDAPDARLVVSALWRGQPEQIRCPSDSAIDKGRQARRVVDSILSTKTADRKWQSAASAFRTCASRWAEKGDVPRQALALAAAASCYERAGISGEANATQVRGEIEALGKEAGWAEFYLKEWDTTVSAGVETTVLEPLIRKWAAHWFDKVITGQTPTDPSVEDLLERFSLIGSCLSDSADDRRRAFLANVALVEIALNTGAVSFARDRWRQVIADPTVLMLISEDEHRRAARVCDHLAEETTASNGSRRPSKE